MDAHAHLTGLGWRGTGYSLDSSDRGLKKPVLVSFKHDERGIGSKSLKEKQADQWWLNAFDSALQDLGTGKISALKTIQQHGIKRGGLYSFFRKGELLEGTLSDKLSTLNLPETMTKTEKKRKRGSESGKGADTEVQELNGVEEPAKKKSKTINTEAAETAPKPIFENGQQYVLDDSTGQKLRVIEGIIIPAPDSLTKKKEKKEPARKKRLREERERKQVSRMEGIKARAEARKGPNFDWEAENRRQIESRIVRQVKTELQRRELAEEFGPLMPSPADLLQMEKEADKGGSENFPQSRLAELSIKVHGVSYRTLLLDW
jgi:nucleolar protein TMA23